MNPRPLGYEHHDAHLQGLVMSLVASLAWADASEDILPGTYRLRHFARFRRVWFTNPFTRLGPATLRRRLPPFVELARQTCDGASVWLRVWDL